MQKAILLVLVLGLGVPAFAQQSEMQGRGEAPNGPYTDPTTGVTFPAHVGDFTRGQLSRIPANDAIFAGYIGKMPTILGAAVVVSRMPPGPDACAIASARSRQEALRDSPDATVTQAEPPSIPGYRANGFSSLVERPGARFPLLVRARSYYCRDNLMALFEFMYPPGTDATETIRSFIQGFALPVRA